MVLLILQFPGVPIINLHFPPEQIPVRMQTAFTKIRVDIQEDRVSSKLSFTDLDLETHGCCVERIVKLHVVPHHTPPILVRLGNTQDLRDWMQRSIMQDVGWASHERVFWNLVWQWGSFDASDSRLKQEGRSPWPNWCSNMFEYIEWLSMIKFDHLLLYIFHCWVIFCNILQQPLYFDILIHCPGQSICDKVARWPPRSKMTALEIVRVRNLKSEKECRIYFMWWKQSQEVRVQQMYQDRHSK